MVRIKTIHLILLFVAFYILTCYYVYKAVDTQLAQSSEYQKWKQNARHDEWPVLNIRKNKVCTVFHRLSVGSIHKTPESPGSGTILFHYE